MVRRIVRTPPKAEAPPALEPKPKNLSPTQREYVFLMRKGWRIMHGQTKFSSSARGHMSFEWGDMLCPPGRDSGQPINTRVVDALNDAGLLEHVKREENPVAKAEGLSDFLRLNSEPRETMRLTLKGKTVEL